LLTDFFLIQPSNQLVYIPDDGSIEFSDPSRSYGFEVKTSVGLTRMLSFDAGLTKVLNAYFRSTGPRVYLDSAPRFTANAALTLADWRGWSGSLRMRAINHYRLDGEDPSIVASGHTVFDLAFARHIGRGVEMNFGVDNLLGRDYWETQNFFASQLPGQPPIERIHATPAYGATVVVGITLRFAEK
jgi:outer membrane receptor protein involved in Fe transport